jgi:hypothetical protein
MKGVHLFLRLHCQANRSAIGMRGSFPIDRGDDAQRASRTAVVIPALASDAWANYRATGTPPHGVELLDAVATCAGGVLAALPLFII